MGDIADMMLEGILDEQTGEYIDDDLSRDGGPGYPRTMNSDSSTRFSFNRQVNGIVNYLYGKGHRKAEEAHSIIKEYGDFIGHKHTKKKNILRISVVIQQDFGKFVTWFNNKK